jgi:small subunit ribosomal protein S8
MHSDPVADMLTRIRNACRARHRRVLVPRSNLKVRIAEILKSEGYIEDFGEVRGKDDAQGQLEIKLKFDGRRDSVITGISRVSKPGLRRYFGATEIPKVRNGLGIMIITTSRGLMTDREARRQGVGGEALCTVW